MDWGIVASVVVALAIFVLGVIVVGMLMFGLAARSIRRKMRAGETPRCPMPGCPLHEEIKKASAASGV